MVHLERDDHFSDSKDKRRYRRRVKAAGILYAANFIGLVLTASYGGMVLKTVDHIWFAVGAFLAFTVGLIVPAFKELMGFADKYAGIEDEFYRKHVESEKEPPDQEVFAPGHRNVWKRRTLIPVSSGLFYALLGIGLLAADITKNFIL